MELVVLVNSPVGLEGQFPYPVVSNAYAANIVELRVPPPRHLRLASLKAPAARRWPGSDRAGIGGR